MIEAQTIGRVKSGEIALRRPTRTDAAMVAGLIDAALRGMEHNLADEADLVWAGGFRYASFLDEPRPLGLILEDTTYRVLRCEVDLAAGARVGEVILALPAEGRGQGPTLKPGADAATDHSHQFIQALAERVNGASSGLEAVLARLRLPLADVLAFEVGMVLALPDAALGQISLEGLDGRRVGLGRLGQNRGLRAVRLGEDAVTSREPADLSSALADLPGPSESPAEFGDFQVLEDFPMDFAATGTD
jgi:flagellar motor switch protein FliM